MSAAAPQSACARPLPLPASPSLGSRWPGCPAASLSAPRTPGPPCPQREHRAPRAAPDSAVCLAVSCAVRTCLLCLVLVFRARYRFPTEAALELIRAPCNLSALCRRLLPSVLTSAASPPEVATLPLSSSSRGLIHCLSFPGPAAARVNLSASPEHASSSLKTNQTASADSKVNPPP